MSNVPPEVVNGDLHVLVRLLQPVGQSRSSRLINDPGHFQPGNLAGLLGSLPLCVVEVSRYGDHRFRHFLTQVIFGGFLHLLKHHGRDFLRAVQPSVDGDPRHAVFVFHLIRHAVELAFHLGVGLAHKPFDRKNGPFRIGNRLSFGRIPHLAFAVFGESHDRRCGAVPLAVRNHNGFVAFHDRDAGVGRPQVDTDNFSHSIDWFFICYFIFVSVSA